MLTQSFVMYLRTCCSNSQWVEIFPGMNSGVSKVQRSIKTAAMAPQVIQNNNPAAYSNELNHE